jgi:hypothetical protein
MLKIQKDLTSNSWNLSKVERAGELKRDEEFLIDSLSFK